MAKVQKGMMVPEELYRLIAWQEQAKGVTFTRQAIAAFLAYFFGSGPYGPDSMWMQLAVQLEKGDITMAQVPLKWADHAERLAKSELDMRDADVQAGNLSDYASYAAHEKHEDAQGLARLWRDVLHRHPIGLEGILMFWEEREARTRDKPMGADKTSET